MLESIAARSRALACEPKLVILHHLTSEGELGAGEMALRVGIHPGLASKHLAGLDEVGLVQRRRSGARVYYRVVGRDDAPGSTSTAQLVWRAFSGPEWATTGWRVQDFAHLSEVTIGKLPPQVARAADVVFDAATAFGNVRRLQVLRLLNDRGRCDAATMIAELHMSPPAQARHMDKLLRRGYVTKVGRGVWDLVRKYSSRFHAALGRDVLRQLGGG